MLRLVLLAISIIEVSFEQVTIMGCLSYKNGGCGLCDQKSWYFKIGSTCQSMRITNCLLSVNGQICSVCIEGYYPDIDTGACVIVATPIKNCISYFDAVHCQTCETEYYVLDHTCAKTAITIPYCVTYSNGVTCSSCANGFLKTPGIVLPSASGFITSGNYCQNFTIPNCQSGGMLSCVKCKSGYLPFQNNYLNIIKGLTGNIMQNLNLNSVVTTLNDTFSTCAGKTVPNCLVFEQFYSCLQCDSGYFVDSNGQCQMIPDPIIENCFEYLTTGVCRVCLAGYYLATQSICSPHSVIVSNCDTMSMTTQNGCALCISGYLLSGNSCVLRSIKISNCQTYSPTSQTCDVCLPSYILSPDGTICYASLNNCASYSFSLSGILCQSCISGMYRDPSLGCINVPTVIPGCVTYRTLNVANANNQRYECEICQTNYLLSNGICTAFASYIGTSILCATTDQTRLNVCASCYDAQILIRVNNYCAPIPAVSFDLNCQTYDSTGWCIVCNQGYFLNSGNCFQITISNCVEVSVLNPLLCTRCTSIGLISYFVNSNIAPNACISTYSHITQNCFHQNKYIESPTSKMNVNVCDNCYSPYFPEIFQTAMFCVPLPTLITNYGTLNKLPSSQNCQVWNTFTQTCYHCQFNTAENFQYLVSNGMCVESCPTGTNIKTVSSPYKFLCSLSTIGNCYREVGSQRCAQCNPFYFPVVQTSQLVTAFDTYAYLPAKYTNHFASKFQSFDSQWNRIFVVKSCLSATPTNGINHISAATNTGGLYPVVIPSADYSVTSTIYKYCKGASIFTFGADQLWGCVSCAFGFTGYYVLDNTQTTQFIPSCVLSIECNFGIYYNGLGFQLTDGSLDFFTGCHVCNGLNLIPTFSRFSRFSSATVGSMPNVNLPYYPQTACLLRGFIQVNTLFPTACAIQEIIPYKILVAYSANIGTVDVNPICWACAPGYKATIELTRRYVSACTLIENCDPDIGLDTFNKCTNCLSGYALDSNMENCVASSIANCYQVVLNGQSLTCLKCQAGYIISRDQSTCNSVNMPNCVAYDPFYLPAINSEGSYLGFGCTQCDIGYIATQFELPQSICVKSLLISIGVTSIKNCLVYSSFTKCSQCSVGYTLPKGNYVNCIPSSTIQNCLVYDSIETCERCQTTYILQDNQCINGAIYNTNCAVFTSQTVCSECSPGYVLYTVGSAVRCFLASSTIQNCLTFNQALVRSSQILSCQTCSIGYPLTLTQSDIKGCITIPTIPYCIEYNINTYKCIICHPTYYLIEQTSFSGNQLEVCARRLNYPDKACKIINLIADSCSVCLNGYYLKNSKCISKPTGVINCAIYQDASTCLKCANNSYLSTNLCRPVSAANIVQNCLYYQNQVSCITCQSGYFLSNNQCLLIKVWNCDVYESPTKCKQCSLGYFLTSDLVCQKPLIVNCVVFGSLNSCQLCATGYYVNANNACSVVPTVKIIPDCLYYSPTQLCLNCTNGTILAKNATFCLSFSSFPVSALELLEKDSNCNSFIYQDNCKVCRGKHLFNNGACVPCNINVPNCFFCDYANVSLCLVCEPGYSQSVTGACLSNNAQAATNNIATMTTFVYRPENGLMPSWAFFSVMVIKLGFFGSIFAFSLIF